MTDQPAWKRRPRWRETTAALDAAERAWWQSYAEVEDQYCWVQTPAIQRFLRGPYVKQICRSIPAGARVLEIGCGTGWLALQLARSGAAEVHGVEFSADQIERARRQAAGSPAGERVRYHVLGRSLDELPALLGSARFDVLLLHAVLHHLSDVELRGLMELFRDRLAARGARAVIVEPVLFRGPDTERTGMDRLVDRLILLPRLGQRAGLRQVSKREAELQQRIDGRGDSPKETPFVPGELEALLDPYLRVRAKTPVLCFSFLAAKNWLLLQVSHPRLGSLGTWPYLALVRSVERRILRCSPGAVWYPLFYLFECDFTERRA
jgi:SAM-dependent methyltransferase